MLAEVMHFACTADAELPEQYSLSCSCLAICLAGAAIVWPSAAALPYIVITVGAVWCWAMHWYPTSLSRTLIACLQAYAGAVLTCSDCGFYRGHYRKWTQCNVEE